MRAKVIELKQHPYYAELIVYLETLRPLVPSYDYKTNNIEEMKVKSVEQRMFDMMMSIINP